MPSFQNLFATKVQLIISRNNHHFIIMQIIVDISMRAAGSAKRHLGCLQATFSKDGSSLSYLPGDPYG